jgi:competence protein ComEA
MPTHRCLSSLAKPYFRILSILPLPLAVLALVTNPTSGAESLEKLPGCTLVQTDWSDGDSFLVRTSDNREFTVRLYGADCIEKQVNDATDERRLRSQRRYFGITSVGASPRESIDLAKGFGSLAANEVGKVLSKPFTIHSSFADARGDGRHKRIYAFVITSDGADLAAHLVSNGMARAFGVSRLTYDGRSQEDYRDYLADLELRAAKLGVGVWAKTNWDKLPEERQQERTDEAETQLALDSQPLAKGSVIDPNTAAKDELMKLPGVGEEIANRIIENRPYSTASDLLKVPGIGQGTLSKIRPHLKLSSR